MLRIRATITVELTADDFIDAARKQARLEEITERVREEFADAELKLLNRWDLAASVSRARPSRRQPGGRLTPYLGEEVA